MEGIIRILELILGREFTRSEARDFEAAFDEYVVGVACDEAYKALDDVAGIAKDNDGEYYIEQEGAV